MRTRLALVLLAAALLAASCSSSDDGAKSGPDTSSSSEDLVVQVASYDLAVGPPARVIAGVLNTKQRLVGYGAVTMRFSYLGTGQEGARPEPSGPPVQASFLPVAGNKLPSPVPTEPRLVEGTERGVYSGEKAFDRAGFWQVEVSARIGADEKRGNGAFQVLEKHAVPAPGDAAPATQNLTLASTDVPKAAIDSRAGSDGEVPDPDLHRTTIAAALAANRPVVVVFATPVYCVSRFCGPVTDLVEELAKSYADRASFVHVEIWRDFQGNVLNEAVKEWRLENEPWVFVIGADGRITARFDNVVSRAELEPLIRDLPVIGPA
ncbi:MAG TPA: hypothetical protein VE760_00060 [Acidimicrobiales bacterium]|nr:hypothetical protein [Acidimicrobiales bacterium]